MNTPRLLGWSVRRTPLQHTPMSTTRLHNMYEQVLRKINKNQVNKKNAFDPDNKICSYLGDFVKMEPNNFPRNGTMINAASIVLGHQIDSVHDRGQTVWNNLMSNSKKNP